MADLRDLPEVTRAYLVCALFTNQEDMGVAHRPGEFEPAQYMRRWSKDAQAKASAACFALLDTNAADVAEYPAESLGHDFWYSRNGHGCGFWEADHTDEPTAQRLQEYARRVGECVAYRGRGGWYHLSR